MSEVVTLTAKPFAQIEARDGYVTAWHECDACHKNFAVSAPVEEPLAPRVVRDIACPYCHRSKAEALVGLSDLPVYLESVERTWAGWKVRRAAAVVWHAWVTVRARSAQIVRRMHRAQRSDEGTQATLDGRS